MGPETEPQPPYREGIHLAAMPIIAAVELSRDRWRLAAYIFAGLLVMSFMRDIAVSFFGGAPSRPRDEHSVTVGHGTFPRHPCPPPTSHPQVFDVPSPRPEVSPLNDDDPPCQRRHQIMYVQDITPFLATYRGAWPQVPNPYLTASLRTLSGMPCIEMRSIQSGELTCSAVCADRLQPHPGL